MGHQSQSHAAPGQCPRHHTAQSAGSTRQKDSLSCFNLHRRSSSLTCSLGMTTPKSRPRGPRCGQVFQPPIHGVSPRDRSPPPWVIRCRACGMKAEDSCPAPISRPPRCGPHSRLTSLKGARHPRPALFELYEQRAPTALAQAFGGVSDPDRGTGGSLRFSSRGRCGGCGVRRGSPPGGGRLKLASATGGPPRNRR